MITGTDTLRVADVELAYHRFGVTADDPFVLLHGFTGSSLDWVDVVDALAREREVITFDHRGHGESTNTGEAATYRFDQLVSDAAGLADGLSLNRFDLLGHSMGGVVAMRYALAHPERVRSLILMDTAAGAAPGNAEMMRAGIELVRTQGTGALFELIQGYLGSDERAETTRARMRTKLEQMDPIAFTELGEELLTYPSLLDRLTGISMPTTVIVGVNDTGLREPAEDLATAIPGAELVVVPEAAHSPQDENRDQWLATVDAHFARRRTSGLIVEQGEDRRKDSA